MTRKAPFRAAQAGGGSRRAGAGRQRRAGLGDQRGGARASAICCAPQADAILVGSGTVARGRSRSHLPAAGPCRALAGARRAVEPRPLCRCRPGCYAAAGAGLGRLAPRMPRRRTCADLERSVSSALPVAARADGRAGYPRRRCARSRSAASRALLVEGGPSLAASSLAADLVDEAVLFQGAQAHARARRPFGPAALAPLTDMTDLPPLQQRLIGADRAVGLPPRAISGGADMFTGIITDIGDVRAVDGGTLPHRLRLRRRSIAIGASIACDGCCLTVTRRGGWATAACSTSMPPTRRCRARRWAIGSAGRRINLERSLQARRRAGRPYGRRSC